MENIKIVEGAELICPKCKSPSLDFDSYEFIDELIKQSVYCNDCGLRFNTWADKPKFWEVRWPQ